MARASVPQAAHPMFSYTTRHEKEIRHIFNTIDPGRETLVNLGQVHIVQASLLQSGSVYNRLEASGTHSGHVYIDLLLRFSRRFFIFSSLLSKTIKLFCAHVFGQFVTWKLSHVLKNSRRGPHVTALN